MPRPVHTALAITCIALVLVSATGCAQTSNAEPSSATTTRPTGNTLAPDITPATSTTSTVSTTSTTSTTTTTLPANVEVIGPSPVPLVAVGTADGDETKKIQERLTALGFWTGDIDGLYGKATTQSVMAFQK